ncbi:hypothetical protein V6N13_093886 [Hibiscus sabdariffa]
MFRYQKVRFDTGATVSVQYALFSFQNPKTVSVRSSRTGTVCLNQIPEAKYRIGTSQAYRYGLFNKLKADLTDVGGNICFDLDDGHIIVEHQTQEDKKSHQLERDIFSLRPALETSNGEKRETKGSRQQRKGGEAKRETRILQMRERVRGWGLGKKMRIVWVF